MADEVRQVLVGDHVLPRLTLLRVNARSLGLVIGSTVSGAVLVLWCDVLGRMSATMHEPAALVVVIGTQRQMP